MILFFACNDWARKLRKLLSSFVFTIHFSIDKKNFLFTASNKPASAYFKLKQGKIYIYVYKYFFNKISHCLLLRNIDKLSIGTKSLKNKEWARQMKRKIDKQTKILKSIKKETKRLEGWFLQFLYSPKVLICLLFAE